MRSKRRWYHIPVRLHSANSDYRVKRNSARLVIVAVVGTTVGDVATVVAAVVAAIVSLRPF